MTVNSGLSSEASIKREGKVIVLGSLNMDIVALTPRIPRSGETIIGSRSFTNPGGKGANQAYAAALLDAQVHMVGAVGCDAHGQALIGQLADAGCAVDEVRRVEEPTGFALISLSEGGENSIIVIPGANMQLLAQHAIEALRRLQPREGDLVLLQLETPIETVSTAARFARRAGACVVLDPAPAPGPVDLGLLASINILTPNESELCVLSGMVPQDLTLDEVKTLASQLSVIVPSIIVKLGRRGCLIVQPDRSHHVAPPRVEAVDTVGAGDIFNGALAAALVRGEQLELACHQAVSAAAFSVTQRGAQSSAPRGSDLTSFNSVHDKAVAPT